MKKFKKIKGMEITSYKVAETPPTISIIGCALDEADALAVRQRHLNLLHRRAPVWRQHRHASTAGGVQRGWGGLGLGLWFGFWFVFFQGCSGCDFYGCFKSARLLIERLRQSSGNRNNN